MGFHFCRLGLIFMSLSIGEQALAVDIIALKTRVKAEMQRRKYNGSLEQYATTEWDFTNTPSSGTQLFVEQGQKIITPLNAINNTGLTSPNVGDQIKAMQLLSDKLTEWENNSVTSNINDCNSACSGLCMTTCYNVCTASCGNNCSGTCSGSCAGDCAFGCLYYCGGCGGCGSSCSGCSGSCTGNCTTSSYYH